MFQTEIQFSWSYEFYTVIEFTIVIKFLSVEETRKKNLKLVYGYSCLSSVTRLIINNQEKLMK